MLNPDLIEDQICKISKSLNLSLKHQVLLQKREEVSEKIDSSFKEKYAFKIFQEIKACEDNIRKNYIYVDHTMIPTLKDLSYEYK
jgi:hypothetical protein